MAFEDELGRLTNAALFAALRTELNAPLRIRCRRDSGKNLLLAMRTKLSRERRNTREKGIKIVTFYLALVGIEPDPEDANNEILIITRSISRRVVNEVYDFFAAMTISTDADMHRLLADYLSGNLVRLNTHVSDVRAQFDKLRSQENANEFDAILYERVNATGGAIDHKTGEFVDRQGNRYALAREASASPRAIAAPANKLADNPFAHILDDIDDIDDGEGGATVARASTSGEAIAPAQQTIGSSYTSVRDASNPFGSFIDTFDATDPASDRPCTGAATPEPIGRFDKTQARTHIKTALGASLARLNRKR